MAVSVSTEIVGVLLLSIRICLGRDCMVMATMVLTLLFWSMVRVGMPRLAGRQDERMIASERDIDNSLKVFNFAFMIAIKFVQCSSPCTDPPNFDNWD